MKRVGDRQVLTGAGVGVEPRSDRVGVDALECRDAGEDVVVRRCGELDLGLIVRRGGDIDLGLVIRTYVSRRHYVGEGAEKLTTAAAAWVCFGAAQALLLVAGADGKHLLFFR